MSDAYRHDRHDDPFQQPVLVLILHFYLRLPTNKSKSSVMKLFFVKTSEICNIHYINHCFANHRSHTSKPASLTL